MPKTSSWYVKQLHSRPAMWLAWAAAILYCSWPLGYVLNPAVGRHDLASQLEALHQPFNWLFITMDVLTGVVIAIAGTWQIKSHGNQSLFKWCALSYVAFGLLNALAAVMPLNCNPETHSCGPLLHNPTLLVHGIASILSVVLLLVSLLGLGLAIYRQRDNSLLRWPFAITLAAWAAFGCGYFVEVLMHSSSNALQYYFITVCSLSLVLVVGAIEYLHLLEPHQLEPELTVTI